MAVWPHHQLFLPLQPCKKILMMLIFLIKLKHAQQETQQNQCQGLLPLQSTNWCKTDLHIHQNSWSFMAHAHWNHNNQTMGAGVKSTCFYSFEFTLIYGINELTIY